jgi:hypothetical protein
MERRAAGKLLKDIAVELGVSYKALTGAVERYNHSIMSAATAKMYDRKCLKCSTKFFADSPYIRLCSTCKEQECFGAVL